MADEAAANVCELGRRELVAWLEARAEATLGLSLHALIRARDAGELPDTPAAMGLAVLLGPPRDAPPGPTLALPSRAHLAAALGCVTDAPWLAGPALRGPRGGHVLTLDGAARLETAGDERLLLAASVYCQPAPTAEAPAALQIAAYAYAAWAGETPEEYIAWHLHAGAQAAAHLHVTGHDPALGALAPLPLPAAPLPFGRVLHWLIATRGVLPRRPDWEAVLAAAE